MSELWAVIAENGATGIKYIVGGKVYTDYYDSVLANEAAGWPGETVRLSYPTAEEREAALNSSNKLGCG